MGGKTSWLFGVGATRLERAVVFATVALALVLLGFAGPDWDTRMVH